MAKSNKVYIGLDQLFQCRALSVPDDRKLFPILAAMEPSHLGGRAEPGSWADPQTHRPVDHSTISSQAPRWCSSKNPSAKEGDTRDVGSIPGSRRSPGVVNGNPLQYSCLKNSLNRGAWQATVHEVTKINCDWAHTSPPPSPESSFGQEWKRMHSLDQ